MKRLLSFLILFFFIITIANAKYIIQEITDEFGDPSGLYEIITAQKQAGTYKTAGTNNGKMYFTMSMDLDTFDLVFVIEENGRNVDLSTALSTDDIYTIKVKDNNGNTFSYIGKLEIGPNYTYNAIRVTSELNNYYSNTLTIPEIGMYCDEVKVVISNSKGTYSLGTINIKDALELMLDKTLYIEAEELYSKGKFQEAKEKILQFEDYDYDAYVYYHGEELKEKIYIGLGEYFLGMTGPAGGFIFYDCDEDNSTGNADGLISTECGWRYLEVAPSDIGEYVFGYYRPDGTNNSMVGTSQAIGSGRYNTEKLVEYMDIDGKAYSDSSGTATAEYAAKKCLDFIYGGYDDWFLPSRGELDLIYYNLCKRGLGSFSNYNRYWSSSEYSYGSAWFLYLDSVYRDRSELCVRAVRAF